MSTFVKFDPSESTVDLDGLIDDNGIQYIGKATRNAATNEWTCLANVGGSLCRVVVRLTPQVPAEPAEPSPWTEAPRRAAWPNDKIPATQTEALLALAVFARTAPGALPERVTAALHLADGVLFDKDKVFAAAQRLESESPEEAPAPAPPPDLVAAVREMGLAHIAFEKADADMMRLPAHERTNDVWDAVSTLRWRRKEASEAVFKIAAELAASDVTPPAVTLPEPEPLHVGTADAPQVAAAKILRREALLLTPAIAAATLAKDSNSAEALLREQADALTKIVDLLAPKASR